MDILQIENNYSRLFTENENIRLSLWKNLRFKQRNYYHSALYKAKKWDGYVDFFTKTGKFLTGLLPEVKTALKYLDHKYQILDRRESVDWTVSSVDENFLGNSITLRDYQVSYINQAISKNRGIIPSPTSSGKTNIMIGILKALPENTPTLILVNKKQLVEQNYDEMEKWDVPNIGKFYGGKKKQNIITCSTMQSAHLLNNLSTIKVLIVDEIHEMMSKKPKQIYAKLDNACVRIGMSATAFKFGGTDKAQKYAVKGWIGPVFSPDTITTSSLQQRNILSTAECHFIVIDQPFLPYDIYMDAVTHGIAENEYFHNIVAKLVKGLLGRSLIIVERTEHGDKLQEKIPNSLWVRGQDNIETRKMIIEKLKVDERVVAIATSGIFNTGINVFIHNLVNAAGGQAEHQIIQRFGRGLRVSGDKSHLRYYDFLFLINDYLEKHSRKRIKVLEKEGHKVNVIHPHEI